MREKIHHCMLHCVINSLSFFLKKLSLSKKTPQTQKTTTLPYTDTHSEKNPQKTTTTITTPKPHTTFRKLVQNHISSVWKCLRTLTGVKFVKELYKTILVYQINVLFLWFNVIFHIWCDFQCSTMKRKFFAIWRKKDKDMTQL